MGLLRFVLGLLLGPPLFLVALVCAAAALAAQQGRSSLQWDVLAHFAPVWLAGGLLAALVALVALSGLGRLAIAALGLVAVVAAGALMLPEYTRSTGPSAPADAPGRIKLIQFNVWDRNAEPERTVDWIAAQHPDIVVLEETTPAFRRLMEARSGLRSQCANCEIEIYSRLPFRLTPLPRFPGRPPGPIVHATFEDARGPFDLIAVHDNWPTEPAQQQPQEARLARAIAAFPRERTLVAGDFNSTPWSFSRRRWDAAFGLIRRDRALFSWPAGKLTNRRIREPVPLLPIDHVYAGPGWATVSVRRGPVLGSDHFPLVAILAPVAPR